MRVSKMPSEVDHDENEGVEVWKKLFGSEPDDNED